MYVPHTWSFCLEEPTIARHRNERWPGKNGKEGERSQSHEQDTTAGWRRGRRGMEESRKRKRETPKKTKKNMPGVCEDGMACLVYEIAIQKIM